ncbi:OLC1v1034060C1 [Oldenlandia corymbosa var. corymbosa]|uniref:U-box domain-containing protein n=1 Tax=Oldenlandia corymbosa var. corymbosa TaxID=529605 RepID=A0AAV1CQC9_OLDCO|nr:OLC1v1034060C1 [Oldenlandia corymbosa var. corymbosa]
MDAVVDVPPFFLCPISLEIMKDPVTVSTGITYDRESIEKWLFSQKNTTCPVTKQELPDSELTPNITLRRVIQAWCTVNASSNDGIERFPTPKAPISKAQLLKLLNEAHNQSPQIQMKYLKRLRSIASHNETNKRCMEMVGTADFLASIVNKVGESEGCTTSSSELTKASDEALSLLCHIQLSEDGLKSLFLRNSRLMESLVRVMQRGSYESRAYAVMLLKSMSDVMDPAQMTGLKSEFFVELVQILNDQISQKASKSALKLLMNVCPGGRNRIKAVEAGLVQVLIDLLVDSTEKRASEMMMVVLEQLCQCAEGRAELLKHSAGLAIVSKKILRVSHVASERAVKILHSVSKFSATSFVLGEMLSLGVVAKLCFVLQMECGSKTKDRAREILKMHARAWKSSPCIPSSLISSYP